ncbi:MAG: hypothetical protein BWY04_00209 [candidate division CPR1 bacterium ADurb.Bin160]|uniref:Uncharacterized protein n=1 Tax=candidate division CPR1 bacterium ADurb.Bin160 TaxID=1852826 RepID=A0A1V5ZQF4_9BACT|nr:MAG: hypothetical protein BWY04_00209 [candidate division CPR1 bacterium ADurb.Bin160]
MGKGEILTYMTLDSRVKNVSATNLELNGIIYKIFEDNTSPSKRFYERLSDKITFFYDSINNTIDMSNSTGSESAMSNLISLKEYIS